MSRKKILKQIGGTCGYYALLNGLNFHLSRKRRLKHKDAKKLLISTIELNHSLMGEIFSYEKFESIIHSFKQLNKEIAFDFERKTVDEVNLEDLEPNQVLLVNFSTNNLKKEDPLSNSHWISIVKRNDRLYELNSCRKRVRKIRKGRLKELKMRIKHLEEKVFTWSSYLKSRGFRLHHFRKSLRPGINRTVYKMERQVFKEMKKGTSQRLNKDIKHDANECFLLTIKA